MSAESATMTTATATEPISAIEEKHVEASQAPAQTVASETAPAAVPAVEEKILVSEPASKPETTDGPVVVPPPASTTAAQTSTTPEKKAVAFDGSAAEKSSTSSTPLGKLFAELPAIIQEAGHDEMWEVKLVDASDVPTSIVLEKFLRANNKDVAKAKAQLIKALKWRKEMQPTKLLDVEFDAARFGGLGYVTVYPKMDSHGKEIVTWNIYGAVKDSQATFGNVEE